MKTVILSVIIFVFSLPSHAASCYNEEVKGPTTSQVFVILMDESSYPEKATITSFRKIVTNLVNTPKEVVILTYAGNASGESLRAAGHWTIEAPITDDEVVNNTVIGKFKKSQKCVREQHTKIKQEVSDTLDGIVNKMPIKTERSEIAYAISNSLQNFVRPGQSVIFLHFSDGVQFSKGANGRSFYGTNFLPRKIDPKLELEYVAKDPTTAPQPKRKDSFVSVIWFGLLSFPTPTTSTSKPVYLNTDVIGAFTNFWTNYLNAFGVDKIQIGSPIVLNPDLSLPSTHKSM